MKTDELVRVLSTNIEAVDTRRVFRELVLAVVAGTLAAITIVVSSRGVRPDIHDLHAVAFLVLKVGLGIGVVTVGSIYLVRLARPGGGRPMAPLVAAWPLVAAGIVAAAGLMAAPFMHWHGMAVGDAWLECLVSIPLIAIVPFAAVVWVLRRMAPTDLVQAGAFAGFVAGGISTIGYGLHCMGDSLPFIAAWYGATLFLCTLAGALLGPRLLRW